MLIDHKVPIEYRTIERVVVFGCVVPGDAEDIAKVQNLYDCIVGLLVGIVEEVGTTHCMQQSALSRVLTIRSQGEAAVDIERNKSR